jgi:predicted nuclease of predicted toxin-antitoxin system
MGVSPRLVEWLRSIGHHALHLSEEGLQRLPDEAILRKAASERRVLLTFDLDFGEIVALAGRDAKVSVVVFRLRNTRTAHVIDRLNHVLATSGGALESGAVIVVEEHRHRVRRVPFAG